MRFFMRLILIVLALPILLPACSKYGLSHNQNKYSEYGKAISPIVVPSGVPAVKQEPYYSVPNVNIDPNQAAVSLVPPGSYLAEQQTLKNKK